MLATGGVFVGTLAGVVDRLGPEALEIGKKFNSGSLIPTQLAGVDQKLFSALIVSWVTDLM